MKPINFTAANTQIAEEQPQYMTLPAFVESGGEVTSVWELTEAERFQVAVDGFICLKVHTFNNPLPPVQLWVPETKDVEKIPHE